MHGTPGIRGACRLLVDLLGNEADFNLEEDDKNQLVER